MKNITLSAEERLEKTTPNEPFRRCRAAYADASALHHRVLDIQQRRRFGLDDSLIIASALAAGCTKLLTEDRQHGQRIDTLVLHNPFA